MKIQSPRLASQHAQHTDMKLLLAEAHKNPGLVGGAKWPELGLPPTIIQGVKVWVERMVRVPGKKSSKHRVLCECPGCKQVLSVGRLHQHVCKKRERLSRQHDDTVIEQHKDDKAAVARWPE